VAARGESASGPHPPQVGGLGLGAGLGLLSTLKSQTMGRMTDLFGNHVDVSMSQALLESARKHALKCNKNRVKAGLDEGLPSLSISHLVYTENPHDYNKRQ
jgi:hypothetical protein